MKLAVIGNKDFIDRKLLSNVLDNFNDIDLIVSGGAVGTDTMAIEYAKSKGLNWIFYPPDFAFFGKKAKTIRNKMIVQTCDKLVAFWDQNCESTRYTIQYAREKNKTVTIVDIRNNEKGNYRDSWIK